MEQLKRIVKEANDTRIAQRALLERELKDMRDRLSLVEPDIIKELDIELEEFECRKVFPSLYAETFSLEEYDKEATKFEAIMKRIDTLRNKLIDEAKRELALC